MDLARLQLSIIVQSQLQLIKYCVVMTTIKQLRMFIVIRNIHKKIVMNINNCLIIFFSKKRPTSSCINYLEKFCSSLDMYVVVTNLDLIKENYLHNVLSQLMLKMTYWPELRFYIRLIHYLLSCKFPTTVRWSNLDRIEMVSLAGHMYVDWCLTRLSLGPSAEIRSGST